MAVTISAKVGYFGRSGGNADVDVKKVHGLLAGLPPGQTGKAVAGFNPAVGYSAKTDQAIYNFQVHHGLVPDATVDRIGPTLDALNRLSRYAGNQPAPPPAPAPAPSLSAPRPLILTVTSRTKGKGLLVGYEPEAGKPHRGLYEADLYEIILSNRVEGQPPYRVEVQPPWDLRRRAEVAPAELVGVARPGRFRRSVRDGG